MGHMLAWLTHTRTEVLAAMNMLSQVTQDTLTLERVKSMKNVIKHITDSNAQGLMMRKPKIDSTNIIV